MKKATTIHATITLGGFATSKAGFTAYTDLARRLEIPKVFRSDDIRRAQRDCEILGEKLKSNPKRAAALFQCIVDNKLDEARKLSKELGIEEQEFHEKGGGLMWLVVIAILLYATDAW